MSKEDRNSLLAHFLAWDKNGDGVLSKEEIFEGYNLLYGEVRAKEETVQFFIFLFFLFYFIYFILFIFRIL